MQRPKRLTAGPESSDTATDPRRVLAAFAVLLYTFLWLTQSILTRDFWLKDLFRPLLPNWALLAVAFTTPITCVLVGLRSIPWKTSLLASFVLSIQGALFGLVGEKYRFVQGAVTLFVYVEAFVILPRWNRRIESGKGDGTVLHLR
jgi:hypothetical protein